MTKIFKSLVSQHPEPRLQGAWNCAQLGLLLFPSFPTLGIVGLLLAVAGVWKQEYRIIVRRPLNWGLALLSIWLVITCCFADSRPDAFLGLPNLLPFFIVFAAYGTLIQSPAQLRQLAKILLASSLPVVILGFGQLFWGWSGAQALQAISGWVLEAKGNPPGRMASVFMHANILAAYLQVVFILGLGLWIEVFQTGRKSGKLWFLTVAVAGNAIALFLTNSRNVWGIAVIACLAFALYLGWRWIVIAVTTAAGIILWASFAPVALGSKELRSLIPSFFWARLSDQMYSNRPVALMRKTQWQFALSMTQQRPLMGWGLRNFRPLYEAKMHLALGHPHNLILMLTAETGIPATLLFCGLIGWILAQAVLLLNIWSDVAPTADKPQWHQDKLILFSYLLAFAGCTLFNMFDVTLFDLRVNTLGWIIFSAICGMVYRYRGLLIWRKLDKPHG